MMNRFWDLIIHRLFEAMQARCLIEVGVARGLLTEKVLAYCNASGAVLHAIDPAPQIDVDEWATRYGERLIFHRSLSLDVLPEIHGVDAVLIDGDHNWYTVFHELRAIETTAAADGAPPPLIVLHDVDWPYGRRDMYYDPETIPPTHRHPHRRAGLLPGQDEPGIGGVNWNLDNALHEGSERNGVRTAVEDFAAQSPLDWQLFFVPGFHGLGIAVAPERLDRSPGLRPTLASLGDGKFLTVLASELELSRISAEIDANRALVEAQELTERKLLAEVEERLAEVDRLQELLVDAERRLAVVPDLQEQLTDLQRELQTARGEAESARQEARLLDQRLTQGERVLSDVLNSPSWRVTQPLRSAKDAAPRLRKAIRR